MRKLFFQAMVSLDGYVEGPHHDLTWHVVDEDYFGYVTEMLDSIDAILLGRATYELFAAHWPTATSAEARAMNELPKIVFSRSLQSVTWRNARLESGDAAAEIASLKRQPGKDLAILGSNTLAASLAPLGLIDEYRIGITPVVLGAGTPLLQGITQPVTLRLFKREPLESGVVIHYYKAAPINAQTGSREGT
jgi:dihydrofolate reductase